MSSYFDRPALVQSPDAQRASSSSSSSISSNSSYGFDRCSKVSQFTDLTPLTTPVDFGNGPELRPVPRFPDLLAWEGLTDEQWKLHSLLYQAERAIERAEKGILTDLGEDFLREDIWYDDDLYDADDGFDTVGPVHARLVSDDEVLDTPDNSITHGRRSDLEAFEEVDDREPDSLFNVTFPSPFLDIVDPPTPLIRPVDFVWDRPSFSTSDTSASIPNFISQVESPLVLNNPATTSSPEAFRNSFRNVDPRSPIVAISSFLLSSRLPLPTSLLKENLDEVAARLRNGEGDIPNVVLPRAEQESCAVPFIDEFPGYEFQKSQLNSTFESGVLPMKVGTLCNEAVLPFETVRSPWDILVEGLGQSVASYFPTTPESTIAYTSLATNIGLDGRKTVTAGSNHLAASTSFITSTNVTSEVGETEKGLGLRLPMGVKQRVSRCCTSGIPTSEACQDLVNLASSLVETDSSSIREFRGHVLSPIAEEAPQLDPCPTFTIESKPVPKKRRKFFKRILSFLFGHGSIRR